MPIEVWTRLRVKCPPVAPEDVARKADLISGEGVNYSMVGIDTHIKWVEGSPVWRKVIIATTGSAIGIVNQIGHVPDFITLIRLEGYCIAGDGYRIPLGFYAGGSSWFSLMVHEDGRIAEIHGQPAYSNCRVVVIVDYVPVSAEVTAWDRGTTVWDNGSTHWDIAP